MRGSGHVLGSYILEHQERFSVTGNPNLAGGRHKNQKLQPPMGPHRHFWSQIIMGGLVLMVVFFFFSAKLPPNFHTDFLIQNFQSAHLSRAWSVQFVRDEFNTPNPFAEFLLGCLRNRIVVHDDYFNSVPVYHQDLSQLY